MFKKLYVMTLVVCIGIICANNIEQDQEQLIKDKID